MADYNRGGYIAFMFCMAFTIAFFVYIGAIHPGVKGAELPATSEKGAEVAAPAAAQ
jgi:hypothetical protein